MISSSVICFGMAILFAVAGAGCGRKDKTNAANSTEAAKKAEETFQDASPEAKQSVAAAASAVNAAVAAPAGEDLAAQRARFIEALRPMRAAMSQGKVTQE